MCSNALIRDGSGGTANTARTPNDVRISVGRFGWAGAVACCIRSPMSDECTETEISPRNAIYLFFFLLHVVDAALLRLPLPAVVAIVVAAAVVIVGDHVVVAVSVAVAVAMHECVLTVDCIF